jgi:enoyl-CoA hydratase/carnithine racemase
MTTYNYETICSEITADGVRTISLNRPHAMNAMNRLLINEISVAFDDANRDPKTRAIIFTGKGRAFCAGDDRHEHVHPDNEEEARAVVDAIQRATVSIVMGAKPVVGAINGWAVGGGFEWAINCDFPIWAESARAFFPEVSLNLFVTGAVTSILPNIVGPIKAREMLFLGNRYTAAELKEIGVAWKVVPDDELLAEAEAVAKQLAALPTLSTRAMKRVLNQAISGGLQHTLSLETEATVAAFLDPETTRLLKDF